MERPPPFPLHICIYTYIETLEVDLPVYTRLSRHLNMQRTTPILTVLLGLMASAVGQDQPPSTGPSVLQVLPRVRGLAKTVMKDVGGV